MKILFAVLLLAASFARADETEETPPAPDQEMTAYGLSGNAVVVDPSEGLIAPSLGVRGLHLANEGKLIYKGSGSGAITAIKDGDRTYVAGHLAGHGGVGRLQDNGLTYMAIAHADYDGISRDGESQGALVLLPGAELGKRWQSGHRGLYLGAHSGMGILVAHNGTEVVNAGTEDAYHDPRFFNRVALAYGASASARLDREGGVGSVVFDGSVSHLVGEGVRYDAAVDVNVSEDVQLGAGLRGMAFTEDDPAYPQLESVQPFVRLTLGGGSVGQAAQDSDDGWRY